MNYLTLLLIESFSDALIFGALIAVLLVFYSIFKKKK